VAYKVCFLVLIADIYFGTAGTDSAVLCSSSVSDLTKP
jgi:hypothetical protein